MFKRNKKEKFITIYVVDDTFFVRKSIYEYLYKKPQNMDIIVGFDFVGEAALKREFKDQLPHIQADLFFIDMDLPDGTAWDLIEEIYQRFPNSQIIAMTDENSIETQQLRREFEDQVVAVLEKPFQPNHLYEVFELAIQERFELKKEAPTPEPIKTFRPRIHFEAEEEKSETKESTITFSFEESEEFSIETEEESPLTLTNPSDSIFNFETNDVTPQLSDVQFSFDEKEKSLSHEIYQPASTIATSTDPVFDFKVETSSPQISETPLSSVEVDFSLDFSTQPAEEEVVVAATLPRWSENERSEAPSTPDSNSLDLFDLTEPIPIRMGSWMGENPKTELSNKEIFEHSQLKPTKEISEEVVIPNGTPSVSGILLMDEVYEDDEFEAVPTKKQIQNETLILKDESILPISEKEVYSYEKREESEENKGFNLIFDQNLSFSTENEEKNPRKEENFIENNYLEDENTKNEDIEEFIILNKKENLLNEEKEEGNLALQLTKENTTADMMSAKDSQSIFSFELEEVSNAEDRSDEFFEWQASEPITQTSPVNHAENLFEWDLGEDFEQKIENDSNCLNPKPASETQFEYFETPVHYTETSQKPTEEFFYFEETEETTSNLPISNFSFKEEAPEPIAPDTPVEVTSSKETSHSSFNEFVISPPRSKGPGVPNTPKEFGRFGIRK